MCRGKRQSITRTQKKEPHSFRPSSIDHSVRMQGRGNCFSPTNAEVNPMLPHMQAAAAAHLTEDMFVRVGFISRDVANLAYARPHHTCPSAFPLSSPPFTPATRTTTNVQTRVTTGLGAARYPPPPVNKLCLDFFLRDIPRKQSPPTERAVGGCVGDRGWIHESDPHRTHRQNS